MKKSHIIEKWIQEDARNQMDSTMKIMAEKKEIIGHLFKIRKVTFMFERIYYRLKELKGYFDEGYGREARIRDMSAQEFFDYVKKMEPELKKRMARVRFITKLYAKRNDGSVPTDEFSTGF